MFFVDRKVLYPNTCRVFCLIFRNLAKHCVWVFLGIEIFVVTKDTYWDLGEDIVMIMIHSIHIFDFTLGCVDVNQYCG
jgi:hypothetical protein